MPQIDANGIRLEYESFGSKSQPAVLLIQGMGAQLIHWPIELCHALVARGFRAIRFDNRDIGLSTRFDAAGVPGMLTGLGARLLPALLPYTLDDMARDVVGLLDALGIARAHIAGASLGGMIAQLVAADHPRRTLSLTSIMSTTGRMGLPGPRPDALAAMMAPYPPADDREAIIARSIRLRRALQSPAYPTTDAELRELIVLGLERSYNPAGASRQMAAALASGDRRAKLARIRAPSVVLHGEDDPLIPLECGIDTANSIAGAEMRAVPGMGHDFPVPLVPVFTDAILRAAARAAA